APGSTQPDEALQAHGGQPANTQPNGGQPARSQPDVAQPDGGQPDGSQPDEDRPGNDQPGSERVLVLAAEAVRLLDRPHARREWAAAQVFLGRTYRVRGVGDPTGNLDRAQAAYRQALTVYRRRSHAAERAATLVNLANTYWSRHQDRPAHLRRAERRYAAALAVFARDTHPRHWATTQSNLGLIRSDPAWPGGPDHESAIGHLTQALQIPELDTEARGTALLNLSLSYQRR